ncbi:MAG: hypothetical protein Ct9H90mP16_20540 [Candidatus Poseidoniales archaeon]|nr:MAG: hypothetical protein Ct9H90mP16_20540 [Candidatus Poseidoniales archaeon]
MHHPRHPKRSSATRSVILALLMVSSLFAYTPMGSANPASGVIDTFADGSASLTVQTDSTAPTPVNLTFNATHNWWGFVPHTYDVNDPSPGFVDGGFG